MRNLNRFAMLLFFVAITAATVLVIQEISNRRRGVGWCYIANENPSDKKTVKSDLTSGVSGVVGPVNQQNINLTTALAESFSGVSGMILTATPFKSDSLLGVSNTIKLADQQHAHKTGTEDRKTDADIKNVLAERFLSISEVMGNINQTQIETKCTSASDSLEQKHLCGGSDVFVPEDITTAAITSDLIPKPGESNSMVASQHIVSIDEEKELDINSGDATFQPTFPVEILPNDGFHTTLANEPRQNPHAVDNNSSVDAPALQHAVTIDDEIEPDANSGDVTLQPTFPVEILLDDDFHTTQNRASLTILNTHVADITSSFDVPALQHAVSVDDEKELDTFPVEISPDCVFRATHTDSPRQNPQVVDNAAEVTGLHTVNEFVDTSDLKLCASPQKQTSLTTPNTAQGKNEYANVESPKGQIHATEPESKADSNKTANSGSNANEPKHLEILNADHEANLHEPSEQVSVERKCTDMLTNSADISDATTATLSPIEDIKQRLNSRFGSVDLAYIVDVLSSVPLS
jgi:hypothetical protein